MSRYGEDVTAWLAGLQPGDQVACNFGGYSYENYKILTVHKVTPSGIIKTVNDSLTVYVFNKNGRERGAEKGAWSRVLTIVPLTEKVMESIERDQYTTNLSSIKLKELPLKYLRKLNAVYEDYKWEENK